VAPAGLAAAGTGGFTGGLVPATPGLATTGGLGFDATAGTGLAAVAPALVVLFFFHVGADVAPFATTPGNTATGLADAFAATGARGAFGVAERGGGGGATGSAFGGTSSR
jgi:hypothetical protein